MRGSSPRPATSRWPSARSTRPTGLRGPSSPVERGRGQVDCVSVPRAVRPYADQVVATTDAVCLEHLDVEYAGPCRKVVGKLGRRRPCALTRGDLGMWAAGVVYVVGQLNFVFDPAQTPHASADQLSGWLSVKKTTMANKARLIRDTLQLSEGDVAAVGRERRVKGAEAIVSVTRRERVGSTAVHAHDPHVDLAGLVAIQRFEASVEDNGSAVWGKVGDLVPAPRCQDTGLTVSGVNGNELRISVVRGHHAERTLQVTAPYRSGHAFGLRPRLPS